MRTVLALFVGLLARVGRSRQDLLLENFALRHHLMLCARHPRVTAVDRLLWANLRRRWSGWRTSLVILHPDTVGAAAVPVEARDLILRRARENPRWGAVRIRAALRTLGSDVRAETVRRYRRQARQRPPVAADLPPQPARRPLGGGLLPRPDAHVRDGVRLLPHRACPAPHRVRQPHGPSHGGLDLAAADRGHRLDPAPALSDPRPRPRRRARRRGPGAAAWE